MVGPRACVPPPLTRKIGRKAELVAAVALSGRARVGTVSDVPETVQCML